MIRIGLLFSYDFWTKIRCLHHRSKHLLFRIRHSFCQPHLQQSSE